MLVLVGAVKMADRIVREMMGWNVNFSISVDFVV